MKKQLLIGARACMRRLCTGAALLGAVTLSVACDDDNPNAERGESIRVYTAPDEEPINAGIYVDVRGGEFTLFVDANVEYDTFWQDGETEPWARILERRQSTYPGLDEIVMEFKPRQTYSYYTRRTGTLSFSSPENKLGMFVTVYQGAVARISQYFPGFSYGSTNPLISDGEKAYKEWTAVQKGYNWTTTTPLYCFGKNGYIKLGDHLGHGGDLITPYVNELRSDSILMVSFRAVTYSDENNVRDNNSLTVNILGGGVFHDTGFTTREIKAGTYVVDNGAPAESMWKHSNYLLFISKTEKNPITANTQIQFVAGDTKAVGVENSRIFLDNIYVYTLNELNDTMIEVNKGTDNDVILGRYGETPIQ